MKSSRSDISIKVELILITGWTHGMFNRTFNILTALMILLRFKYSQNNRQNLHRRSTVSRIPTAQAESSTESEEEDDRVLDGKVVSQL